MSYVYFRSEPHLWTVGFYRPDGTWESESDHASAGSAARRVAWLNGSGDAGNDLPDSIKQALNSGDGVYRP